MTTGTPPSAGRAATPRSTGGARTGSPRNRAVGEYGERLACRYLTDRGLTVVDRNWRCRDGEIDVVALDGEQVVVVEVKTRTGLGFGHPVEAVLPRKVARLRRLAVAWVRAHPEHRGRSLRVDVIGVLRRPHGPAVVRHVAGVDL